MGGIVSKIAGAAIGGIFGKKSSKKAAQQAGQGFAFINADPLAQRARQQGLQASGLLGGLLGFGNEAAGQRAFDRFKESTGFQFRLDQGQDAIEQRAAAGGLLNSGATLKALAAHNQNLASDEFSKFLAQLNAVRGQGLTSVFNTAQLADTAGARAAGFTRQGAEDVTGAVGLGLQAATPLIDRLGSNIASPV